MRCGAKKFGALNLCKQCGYSPDTNADRAQSILLSDHHHTQAELVKLGEAIRAGRKVHFDQESVEKYLRAMEIMDEEANGLECALCGEEVDSPGDYLCGVCRRTRVQ